MSFLPRLRQACRGAHRAPAAEAREGKEPSAAGKAPGGRAPRAGMGSARQGDPRLALNRLFLSGVVVAEPQEEEDRNGDPIMLLLVAFPAPDSSGTVEQTETASCEIEVPGEVARRHGKGLRAGEAVFVTGQLNGGGGVVATEIYSGPPPEPNPFDSGTTSS